MVVQIVSALSAVSWPQQQHVFVKDHLARFATDWVHQWLIAA
jgi:hypothetical protein